MKNKLKPFPYPFYFWQVVGYALLGLLLSLYLAYTHYKNHTDIGFSSFCAITQAVNCDTVAQSPWSTFWGLPIAVWGVSAYILFLFLLIPLRQPNDSKVANWSLLTLLALLAVCCSICLAVISHTRIHSWCLLCVAIYAINFLLAFSSWVVFNRFSNEKLITALPSAIRVLRFTFPVKIGLPALIVLVIAIRIFIPPYWTQKPIAIDDTVATGITQEGNPWIGAQTPEFTIEEYTDYQCFQCKKMHHFIRQLIATRPDRIRLIHRHFPLDHEFNPIIAHDPFHVGSGRLALIAIVATQHNAFWKVNDALYQAAQTKAESVGLSDFAHLIGITQEELIQAMFSERVLKHLRHDMVEGMQFGMNGTPSFVVNGKLYLKSIPPELLREMLQ